MFLVLALISVVFDIYDEDILEMLQERLINPKECLKIPRPATISPVWYSP
jgi:hypothetical protein